MNKTAELVSLWAQYEAQHPGADLKDFYSEQLLSSGRQQGKTKFLAGLVPAQNTSIFSRLLARLVKLHTNYVMMILKERGIGSIEEFAFLTTIQHLDNPRKSEVINDNFTELSSGLLVLDRLKAKGYTAEVEDVEDKRSKRVHLTAKGKKKILVCQQLLDKLNGTFYKDLHGSSIKLCIDILKPLEIKYSSLWRKHGKKGLPSYLEE